MEDQKEFLREFIEWAEYCGEDAFYIFNTPEKAINEFLNRNNNGNN